MSDTPTQRIRAPRARRSLGSLRPRRAGRRRPRAVRGLPRARTPRRRRRSTSSVPPPPRWRRPSPRSPRPASANGSSPTWPPPARTPPVIDLTVRRARRIRTVWVGVAAALFLVVGVAAGLLIDRPADGGSELADVLARSDVRMVPLAGSRPAGRQGGVVGRREPRRGRGQRHVAAPGRPDDGALADRGRRGHPGRPVHPRPATAGCGHPSRPTSRAPTPWASRSSRPAGRRRRRCRSCCRARWRRPRRSGRRQRFGSQRNRRTDTARAPTPQASRISDVSPLHADPTAERLEHVDHQAVERPHREHRGDPPDERRRRRPCRTSPR